MNRLRPGSEVTVLLVKDQRDDVSYPAVVTSDDGTHMVVRAEWAGAPVRDLGFATFERGDMFTEHYWRDRWYSVKEVRAADGARKGWYCDICRPAEVHAGTVVARDLELDLWVAGDRSSILRLDEDEFVASGLPERDPETAGLARAALDELEKLASDGFGSLLDVVSR